MCKFGEGKLGNRKPYAGGDPWGVGEKSHHYGYARCAIDIF